MNDLPVSKPRQWTLLAFEADRLSCVVPLREGQVCAGRDEQCGMRFNDTAVSRRHCTFQLVDEHVIVSDNDSLNGTLRFGRRIRRSILGNGDEVTMGNAFVKLIDLARPGWAVHAELFEDLYLDRASGLLNRRGFDLRAGAIAACAIAGTELALAFLRIDGFERIGLSQGQQETRKAVERMGAMLRGLQPAKVISAYQGDGEFACFLPGGYTGLKDFAESLRASMAAPAATLLSGAKLTVSIGGATAHAPVDTLAALSCSAYDALFIACSQGGNACTLTRAERCNPVAGSNEGLCAA